MQAGRKVCGCFPLSHARNKYLVSFFIRRLSLKLTIIYHLGMLVDPNCR